MEDKSLLLECDFLLDALIIIFVKKKSGRLNLIRKGSFIIPLFLSFCNSIKMCQSVCADNCVTFDHNCNFMEKTQASTHSRDIWLGKDVFCFAQLRDFALGWSKKKSAIESKHNSICWSVLLIIWLIAVITIFSNQEKCAELVCFQNAVRKCQHTFAKN